MQMQVNHSVLLAFFEFSRTHFSSFFLLHICTTALKSILMLELLLDFWICLSNFSNKTFISWVPEHRFILYQMQSKSFSLWFGIFHSLFLLFPIEYFEYNKILETDVFRPRLRLNRTKLILHVRYLNCNSHACAYV